MHELVDSAAVAAFRSRALNPMHPHQRGTSQDSSIYFQMVESGEIFYRQVADEVERTLDHFADATGRRYQLFDYHGAHDAEHVVVCMGCAAVVVQVLPPCHAVRVMFAVSTRRLGLSSLTALVGPRIYVIHDSQETVSYLVNDKHAKVGVVSVHLFMPWSTKHFLAALPSSVRRIAVLDRTKEAGALGEPLWQTVAASVHQGALPDVQVRLRVVAIVPHLRPHWQAYRALERSCEFQHSPLTSGPSLMYFIHFHEP
jgi:pyruvate-ferredoxin/flavodoxin oxidoreductase